MSLTDRINHPDRREEELPVIVERRGGTERRVPRWLERARDGKGVAKDLTRQDAA